RSPYPSDQLEVAPALPVGHGRPGGGQLGPAAGHEVVDERLTEQLPGQLAGVETGDRLVEGGRERGDDVGAELVGVAHGPGRFELLLDAVEPAGQAGGDGQVGVGVGAGQAVLDAGV